MDDEKAMRVSLSEIFTLRGAQVTTAADGREAVELLNQHDFDLMLLDLKMPGMSGMQVLEVAQKVRPGTVVILLTAFATLDSAISALRRGAHDYLLKPCEPRALIAGVERGLTKRGEFMRRQSLVGLMEQTVSALKTDPTAPPSPTPPPPGSEDSFARRRSDDGYQKTPGAPGGPNADAFAHRIQRAGSLCPQPRPRHHRAVSWCARAWGTNVANKKRGP